jgi:hypothetical protein
MKTKILVVILFLLSLQVDAQTRTSSKRPWLLSNANEAAAANRFSLAEWLETKNRNNMMDMWMGYNTNNGSSYEFMLNAGQHQYDVKQTVGGLSLVDQTYRSYSGAFTAYAKNVGLTAEYQGNKEEHYDDVTGIFNFRLFGKSLQASHLTLHYGLRTRNGTGPNSYRMNQQFPAGTLQLYIVENFGIFGHYRKYLKVTESSFGETEADEGRYGAFIEFGRLRFFGNIFNENQTSILNGVKTEINNKGTKIGLELYF